MMPSFWTHSPYELINSNSIFNLLDLDKCFDKHNLSKLKLDDFDYYIFVDKLQLSINKKGQHVLFMSFKYTVKDKVYQKHYNHIIPKSKSKVIDWLKFQCEMFKKDKVKHIHLLDGC